MQLRHLVATLALAPAVAVAQPAPGPETPSPAEAPAAPITPENADLPGPEVAPVAAEPPAPETPAAAPAKKGAVSVRYDKGLLFETEDGGYALKLGIRSQFRLEATRPDGDDTEFATRFMIPRLRLQFEGHAFDDLIDYKVEFEMANRGFSLLKDFFIDRAFTKTVHLRVGQWKRPFHRQEVASDFGSEFLERTVVNEFATAGRDLGVALHNDYEKSPDGLEWAAGVWNAGSDRSTIRSSCVPGATPTDPPICTISTPTNVPSDWGPALVAHVGWNGGGIKGYSEGDLEGGPLRYGVSVDYRMNPRDLDKNADGDLQIQHAVSLDTIIKREGVCASGALVLIKDGQADPELGFYGQLSYLVKGPGVLVAGRFAQVPDDDEHRREIAGAVNLLWRGHNLKWMIDGGILQTTGDGGGNDLRIRTQLQASL
jgi:hypothetical protein